MTKTLTIRLDGRAHTSPEAGRRRPSNGVDPASSKRVADTQGSPAYAIAPPARPASEFENYVRELERAISLIGELSDHLSVCSNCKRFGDDEDHWRRVRGSMARRLEAELRRTICPECYESVVRPEVDLLYDSLRSPQAGQDVRTVLVQAEVASS